MIKSVEFHFMNGTFPNREINLEILWLGNYTHDHKCHYTL